MARFALATVCVVACLFAGASAQSSGEFGMDRAAAAYEAVCWYEFLKNFPKTDTKAHLKCTTQAHQVKNQITKPENIKRYFGDWLDSMAMGALPADYKQKCSPLLKTPDAAPKTDESEAINDARNDYPYKAFTYCLMSTLREKHGDKAIQAVKDERTLRKKYWTKTLLDRENEFRARHGVEPLKPVKDLQDAAQKWADENARTCKMEHSDNADPGRQFQGSGTGESLSAGMTDDKEVSAYHAADGWYQEIKDYPYPIGYQGDDEALFKKIGHFTQSVWKDTKYVGYGYAYNPKCKGFKRFIAARYYPAGNEEGKYPENVLAPKD